MKRLTTSSAELKNFISTTLYPAIQNTFRKNNFIACEYDFESVISNVLLKIWSNRDNYSDDVSSYKWFETISRNATKDYIKVNSARRNMMSLDSYVPNKDDDRPISNTYMQIPASVTYNTDYNLELQDTQKEIDRVLSTMTDSEVKIFKLWLSDYSYSEISELLNLSEGACRTSISRTRAKLKYNHRIMSIFNSLSNCRYCKAA